MQTSETLDKAGDQVERGWAQGQLVNSLGQVCAIGGIATALDLRCGCGQNNNACHGLAYPDSDEPALVALARHVGGAGFTPIDDITAWNDEPGRTAAEVIEVLRAAAVIESARESQDAAWATYAELVTV
jgi:hypothetical protein